MERTDVSIVRHRDKEDVEHIHNGILLSHQENTNPAIYNNMDEARGYYAQGH